MWAIEERKKAQRKLFRNPTAENVLAFKQLKAKARHIIKTKENILAKFLFFTYIQN